MGAEQMALIVEYVCKFTSDVRELFFGLEVVLLGTWEDDLVVAVVV